ncbi:MAG: phage Gp37/Gp68 family protein [Chitinophagaceae bacterium]
MSKTSIEWTGLTWNPTTGCNKVSAGCKFCYAAIMSKRLQAMGQLKYVDGFEVKVHPEELYRPYTWKKPQVVFVNSMSDLFHDNVPFSFIAEVFRVMGENPRHIFQVLTKRSERLKELNEKLEWAPNIWMGVSVENEAVLSRVSDLAETGAAIKFLSCEPLIGPLPNLDLKEIGWVIAGGESARKPRPMYASWVRELRDKCAENDVPFFFKQWGGTNKKKAGRLLDGVIHNDMPDLKAHPVEIKNTVF